MTLRHVHERLWYGGQPDCRTDGVMAVVHACKTPCHCNAVGYKGSLPPSHEHYLSYERDHHLFLNMIDPPKPLFKLESFEIFLDFVDREIAQREVMIHCNQGCSRAPSLALLYMAKRVGTLPDESYAAARGGFEQMHPTYQPGDGIMIFLRDNWNLLPKRIAAGNG